MTGNPVFELVSGDQQQKELELYHPLYSGVRFFVKNSFDSAMFGQQDPATQKFLLEGTMNETYRFVHGCLAGIRKGQSVFYSTGMEQLFW